MMNMTLELNETFNQSNFDYMTPKQIVRDIQMINKSLDNVPSRLLSGNISFDNNQIQKIQQSNFQIDENQSDAEFETYNPELM